MRTPSETTSEYVVKYLGEENSGTLIVDETDFLKKSNKFSTSTQATNRKCSRTYPSSK